MLTLDNVHVSIPNQKILKTEIDNFGRKEVVRRKVSITPGYDQEGDFVEKVLMGAAAETEGVEESPPSYVRITEFKDYAVEYTLYVFVRDVLRLREIDARLRKNVLQACRKEGLDISTPLLLHQV